jgi:glyceraldehyde 3-phosphate dehydrogenase
MSERRAANMISGNKPVLGINGFRENRQIDLWNHIGRKFFRRIVVNVAERLTGLKDIALYIEKDSTMVRCIHICTGTNAKDHRKLDEEKAR